VVVPVVCFEVFTYNGYVHHNNVVYGERRLENLFIEHFSSVALASSLSGPDILLIY
jgi:hypothetical protein